MHLGKIFLYLQAFIMMITTADHSAPQPVVSGGRSTDSRVE